MNVYVGNLPWKASEEELKAMFEAYGEVTSAKIIKDNATGKSRGFGFVEMVNNEQANAAIAQLNGKDIGGRPLTVNEAKPREEGGPRRDNRDRGPRSANGNGINRRPTSFNRDRGSRY